MFRASETSFYSFRKGIDAYFHRLLPSVKHAVRYHRPIVHLLILVVFIFVEEVIGVWTHYNWLLLLFLLRLLLWMSCRRRLLLHWWSSVVDYRLLHLWRWLLLSILLAKFAKEISWVFRCRCKVLIYTLCRRLGIVFKVSIFFRLLFLFIKQARCNLRRMIVFLLLLLFFSIVIKHWRWNKVIITLHLWQNLLGLQFYWRRALILVVFFILEKRCCNIRSIIVVFHLVNCEIVSWISGLYFSCWLFLNSWWRMLTWGEWFIDVLALD